MPEPKLLDACIDGAPNLSQVLAHAKRLSRFQSAFASLIPPSLAAACRVANLRGDQLVIHADSGAVAAKIRQLSVRICRELSFQGLDCTGINVAVQDGPKARIMPAPAIRPVSAAAFSTIQSLIETLPSDDPLAERLGYLLERSVKAEEE